MGRLDKANPTNDIGLVTRGPFGRAWRPIPARRLLIVPTVALVTIGALSAPAVPDSSLAASSDYKSEVPAQTPEQVGGPSNAVAAFGRGVLLGVGNQVVVLAIDGLGHLAVIDWSEPLAAQVSGIVIDDLIAYVSVIDDHGSSSSGGLVALDITDPYSVTVLSTLNTVGGMRDVALDDRGFVVAAGDGAERPSFVTPGKLVVAKLESDDLQIVASVPFHHSLRGLAIDGTRAYVVEGRWGAPEPGSALRVLDIEDPLQPRKIQKTSLKGQTGNVAAHSEMVLVAAKDAGVYRFKAPRDESVALVERWDPRGCISRVVSSDNRLLFLNPCAGSLQSAKISEDGFVPIAQATGLGEPSDATEVFEFVVVTKGPTGGAFVLVQDDDALRIVAEYIPGGPPRRAVGSLAALYGRSSIDEFNAPHSGWQKASADAAEQVPLSRLFLPWLITPAPPPPDSQLVIRTRLGGSNRAVAAKGDVIYAGEGSSVIVLDSSGSDLTLIGRGPDLGGVITDLKIAGSKLFAAVGEAGVAMLSLTEPPSVPILEDTVTTGDWAMAVDVQGDTLLAAALDAGLERFAIDNGSLTRLGAIDIAGRPRTVISKDEFVYVGTNDGEKPVIVDLSNGQPPRKLPGLSTMHAGWHPYFFIIDSLLYAFRCGGDCLDVFDIEDPDEVGFMANIPGLRAAWDLPVIGNADGERAFVANSNGIAELDVSARMTPRYGASVETPGHILGMEITGERLNGAYTRSYDVDSEKYGFTQTPGGVISYDVTPCCSDQRTYRNEWGFGVMFPSDSSFSEKYAQWPAVSKNGEPTTHLVDFSNPLAPVPGRLVSPSLNPDMQVVGHRGYQPDRDLPGISVFDLSDPGNPRRLPGLRTPGQAALHPIDDATALVSWPVDLNAAPPTTVVMYDLSSDVLNELGRFNVTGKVVGAVRDEDYIQLVTAERWNLNSLVVVDVTRPATPTIVSTEELPSPSWGARAIALVGPRTLLVADWNGLMLVDTSVATTPRFEFLSIGRRFDDLMHIKGDLWLASGDGVVLYDMSNPRAPRTVSVIERVGYFAHAEAYRVVAHDKFLYLHTIADVVETGLTVVEIVNGDF
jgi:hypothetical protein